MPRYKTDTQLSVVPIQKSKQKAHSLIKLHQMPRCEIWTKRNEVIDDHQWMDGSRTIGAHPSPNPWGGLG